MALRKEKIVEAAGVQRSGGAGEQRCKGAEVQRCRGEFLYKFFPLCPPVTERSRSAAPLPPCPQKIFPFSPERISRTLERYGHWENPTHALVA
ncbi:hypothetical protein [Nostoc flagelliforme]|uniref:hypothetical protein n=1 Tax=Nostoc flagelliforme TaxID=1306274 RepID=UPI00142DDD2C|nr:hypothetical protein [Nostoc flagelliforme]